MAMLVAILVFLVLLTVILRKGDVKAGLRIPFFAFFFDAKERKGVTGDRVNEDIFR